MTLSSDCLGHSFKKKELHKKYWTLFCSLIDFLNIVFKTIFVLNTNKCSSDDVYYFRNQEFQYKRKGSAVTDLRI